MFLKIRTSDGINLKILRNIFQVSIEALISGTIIPGADPEFQVRGVVL